MFSKTVTKEELIEKLVFLTTDMPWDTADIHKKADALLLEYINDDDVSREYLKIEREFDLR